MNGVAIATKPPTSAASPMRWRRRSPPNENAAASNSQAKTAPNPSTPDCLIETASAPNAPATTNQRIDSRPTMTVAPTATARAENVPLSSSPFAWNPAINAADDAAATNAAASTPARRECSRRADLRARDHHDRAKEHRHHSHRLLVPERHHVPQPEQARAVPGVDPPTRRDTESRRAPTIEQSRQTRPRRCPAERTRSEAEAASTPPLPRRPQERRHDWTSTRLDVTSGRCFT